MNSRIIINDLLNSTGQRLNDQKQNRIKVNKKTKVHMLNCTENGQKKEISVLICACKFKGYSDL